RGRHRRQPQVRARSPQPRRQGDRLRRRALRTLPAGDGARRRHPAGRADLDLHQRGPAHERVRMSNAAPGAVDRYAVIGNPVAHSLSPAIHARFAADCGQSLAYERLLAPVDGFRATVAAFREAGGRGLNVTVPFKREAAALADRPSERVRQAGAANTLGVDADGIWADNADGLGLVEDLRGRLGLALAGVQLVLLGAGGAARGVVGPLLAAGVDRLVVIARRPEQAAELVAAFP